MNTRISVYLLCLLSTSASVADETNVDSMKLDRLNQSSQQGLQIIQQSNKNQTGSGSSSNGNIKSNENLNLHQQLDQLILQESQSRKQAVSKHRSKTGRTQPSYRSKANAQHKQFRQEQKTQLNQFRLQQKK